MRRKSFEVELGQGDFVPLSVGLTPTPCFKSLFWRDHITLRAISLADKKIKQFLVKLRINGLPLAVTLGLKAYGILATSWLFTLKSIRYLVLLKGGKNVTFVSYTPFGENRLTTVNLNKVSCEDSRHSAKVQLPIKVEGHRLFYILDMRGEFLNPRLFDHTVGLKRMLNRHSRKQVCICSHTPPNLTSSPNTTNEELRHWASSHLPSTDKYQRYQPGIKLGTPRLIAKCADHYTMGPVAVKDVSQILPPYVVYKAGARCGLLGLKKGLLGCRFNRTRSGERSSSDDKGVKDRLCFPVNVVIFGFASTENRQHILIDQGSGPSICDALFTSGGVIGRNRSATEFAYT
uniref:Uncharacterized protein n=1 Tax=Timema tahoe TaxID=61484 RepID=A0A7R9FLI6_9NEOP|nr:unnamed protein product [Timema tahoe]